MGSKLSPPWGSPFYIELYKENFKQLLPLNYWGKKIDLDKNECMGGTILWIKFLKRGEKTNVLVPEKQILFGLMGIWSNSTVLRCVKIVIGIDMCMVFFQFTFLNGKIFPLTCWYTPIHKQLYYNGYLQLTVALHHGQCGPRVLWHAVTASWPDHACVQTRYPKMADRTVLAIQRRVLCATKHLARVSIYII